MFITGISKLYRSCRRSSSSLIVGISFLSPAEVPELRYQMNAINDDILTTLESTRVFFGRWWEIIFAPGQEFSNGMCREDGRPVPVGDALDLRLEILVSDHREFGLERLSVSSSRETVPLQVFCLRVLAQNLRQHGLLHPVGVSGHLFYELELLGVVLAGRRS